MISRRSRYIKLPLRSVYGAVWFLITVLETVSLIIVMEVRRLILSCFIEWVSQQRDSFIITFQREPTTTEVEFVKVTKQSQKRHLGENELFVFVYVQNSLFQITKYLTLLQYITIITSRCQEFWRRFVLGIYSGIF